MQRGLGPPLRVIGVGEQSARPAAGAGAASHPPPRPPHSGLVAVPKERRRNLTSVESSVMLTHCGHGCSSLLINISL